MTTTLPPDADEAEPHPSRTRRGLGWLGIGASFGLALGTGLHFALPADGTNTPDPSSSSSPSAAPSPAPSNLPSPAASPIDEFALASLNWTSAAPSGVDHGSNYPASTIATDEILADVGPLWALEVFSEARYSSETGPTNVYLIDPAGNRYEVVSIPNSLVDSAWISAWDPEGGWALLELQYWDGNSYVLVDLNGHAWAPVEGPPTSGNPDRLGTASNGTPFWIVPMGDNSVRLASWDFTYGWSWAGEAFDTLNTCCMSLPYGGDWFTYHKSSSPNLQARNVLTGETRRIEYPATAESCEAQGWIDATTIVLRCWDASGRSDPYAAFAPEFDTSVSSDASIDVVSAMGVTERYQVPGTPLILTGNPLSYEGGLTAIGLMTTEGYREIEAYSPQEAGMVFGPYFSSIRQLAPGLYVFSDDRETAVLVVDIVTGQVVDYSFDSPNWNLFHTSLINAPEGDSS